MNKPIELMRVSFLWGSYGKFHDEPLRRTLLKDISDSHLLHIISWIEDRSNSYSRNTLEIMKAEQRYRCQHYIFVKDYDDNKSS